MTIAISYVVRPFSVSSRSSLAQQHFSCLHATSWRLWLCDSLLLLFRCLTAYSFPSMTKFGIHESLAHTQLYHFSSSREREKESICFFRSALPPPRTSIYTFITYIYKMDRGDVAIYCRQNSLLCHSAIPWVLDILDHVQIGSKCTIFTIYVYKGTGSYV